MRRLAVILAVSALAMPAVAATDEDCARMWKNADANGDGIVTGAEADRFAAAFQAAGKPAPVKLDQPTFIENCKAGVFTTAATTDQGAPLAGANSFTENQAKDRITAAGFTNVSALTKDDNGIWRGTASRDGKSVNVAVDYKGNVVAN
jgi:hypothetical protein